MRFDFDPAKSAANKLKHGLDFVEAQALWDDPQQITRFLGWMPEPRRQLIGRIGQKVWCACVTDREPEIIRIISVRRARRDEEARYHGAIPARETP